MAGPVKYLIGLFLAEFALGFTANTVLAIATTRLGESLRKKYFQAILRQDAAFFDEHSSGQLMQHMSDDISSVCTAIRQTFTTGLRSAVKLVGGKDCVSTSLLLAISKLCWSSGAASVCLVSPHLASAVAVLLPVMGIFS